MCNIDTYALASRLLSGDTVRGRSEEELRNRAEKDQKKVKLFEKYTKILDELTYQEWIDLREEMDGLFEENLHDIVKTATLQTLRDITKK